MNVMLAALLTVSMTAQQPARDTTPVARLEATPAQMTIEAGQTLPWKVTAYDAAGRVIASPSLRASGARGALALFPDSLRALRAGRYEITVSAVQAVAAGATPVTVVIPVTVSWPGSAPRPSPPSRGASIPASPSPTR